MTFSSPDAPDEWVTLSVDQARELIGAALAGLGLQQADIEPAVEHFIAAEERGNGGIERLSLLADAIERHGLPPCRPIRVLREGASTALLDGGGHVGYAVAARATEIAIAKARETGIAVVAANNHRYSGVLGLYAERVARNGFVAMATGTGTIAAIAPFGGREAGLCTNPIAFAFPGEEDPIVWDTASAAISGHLFELAERSGGLLPAGVALDADGHPTRDPRAARAGALLAWGGHRGSGLAIAIQLLGFLGGLDAVLEGPADWTAAFVLLAIDPARFLPGVSFAERVSEFADGIRATPAAPGHDAVRMPSDRSLGDRERRRAHGLDFDPPELDRLRSLADQAD